MILAPFIPLPAHALRCRQRRRGSFRSGLAGLPSATQDKSWRCSSLAKLRNLSGGRFARWGSMGAETRGTQDSSKLRSTEGASWLVKILPYKGQS